MGYILLERGCEYDDCHYVLEEHGIPLYYFTDKTKAIEAKNQKSIEKIKEFITSKKLYYLKDEYERVVPADRVDEFLSELNLEKDLDVLQLLSYLYAFNISFYEIKEVEDVY
ncbi:MAG: hypothetical protein AABY07_01400 [Nanoarchaeota archaeon]